VVWLLLVVHLQQYVDPEAYQQLVMHCMTTLFEGARQTTNER
jgi:hypothetical protein